MRSNLKRSFGVLTPITGGRTLRCHAPMHRPLSYTAWKELKSLDLLAPRSGKRWRPPPTMLSIRAITPGKTRFYRVSYKARNRKNLLIIPLNTSDSLLTTIRSEFASNTLLSNVMTLAPKIDEICLFTSQDNFDYIFLTETWLRFAVGDNHVTLPNYNLTRRDGNLGIHGGLCLYLKKSIKFKHLDDLHDSDFEVLWAHARPQRTQRGFPCIVTIMTWLST